MERPPSPHRQLNARTPKSPEDVPRWLTEIHGAPPLVEVPGANRVAVRWTTEPEVDDAEIKRQWMEGAGDERVRLWRAVLDALELAGQRLVGGGLAWALRERQLRIEASRLPAGSRERDRLLTRARKAKLARERSERPPHEEEHARATFLNTLQVCAPGLEFRLAVALAWWLGLLPQSAKPFDPGYVKSLRRLADRHWTGDFSRHSGSG